MCPAEWWLVHDMRHGPTKVVGNFTEAQAAELYADLERLTKKHG
jgi:hypothetical protein